MTLADCYEMIGGDYENLFSRFPDEKLIERVFLKFENDKSFESLMVSCEKNDRIEAFKAAHSLKGIAANLSLTGLASSASGLTEQLRKGNSDPDTDLVADIVREYKKVIEALIIYKGSLKNDGC